MPIVRMVPEVAAVWPGRLDEPATGRPHGTEANGQFFAWLPLGDFGGQEGPDLEGRLDTVLFVLQMTFAEEQPAIL